jgi:FdhD protein
MNISHRATEKSASSGEKVSPSRVGKRELTKVDSSGRKTVVDSVAREEPLEIQVRYGPEASRAQKVLAITMRTPGHDRELAVGFLLGEGLIRDFAQVESVHTCGPRFGDEGWTNSVRIVFRPEVDLDLTRLERNFYMTSSCGVCGKTSVEMLETQLRPRQLPASFEVEAELIGELPGRLRRAQAVFEQTGGLHAAGLFTRTGEAICVREDVGRHNAVDKVMGAQFLAGREIEGSTILVVSGRASFELMQKAVAAGISMLVAVGAPSSLAVELAERSGASLIGFVKPGGFNIYTGADRIAGTMAPP